MLSTRHMRLSGLLSPVLACSCTRAISQRLKSAAASVKPIASSAETKKEASRIQVLRLSQLRSPPT